MKIGVLIDRLNVGGVEKIAIEEVRALRDNGEDATLVVLSRKAVIENAFLDLRKNLPIIYLDDRLPSFLRLTFKFPVFSFFSFLHISYPLLLPIVVKRNEFDYFIVHGTYTSFSAITLRKFCHISFSSFIWDPISYILERVYIHSFPRPIYKTLLSLASFLDRIIIRNSDVILAGGDAHNKIFRRLIPQKKVVIIYPSVHPIKKQKKKKDYILMVTAWKRGKDPEYIFELIKKIPNCKIIMVGKWLDPLYLKEFKNEIKKAKMEKNIDIVGSVTETQLSKYYEEALFVFQSNDDRGFGLPALEGAGHGTTFIIPQGQGVCKLFTNAVEGFYIKEKDTQEIVKLMKLLIKDKGKTKKMGEHALQRVKENYSWKKHALLLKKVIEGNYKKV